MKMLIYLFAMIVATRGAAAQDYALQFDAVQPQQLITWHSLDHISNTFTMELWVKPTMLHEIDAEATSGYDGISGQRYAIFPNWYATDEAGAGISIGTNGVSVYEHADGYMPALLVWEGPVSGCTHVAVVYDAKTPKLYINGDLVRTGKTSARTMVHPSINHIGWGGYYGGYSGILDEIRVWDIALTAAQIQDRMNTRITNTDPLWNNCAVYLPFREGRWTMTEDVADADHWPKTSFLGSTYLQRTADSPTWVAGRFNSAPIIREPEDAVRCVGETVMFSVEASGTGLGFQWRKDGNPIGGATEPTYTISPVAGDDAGEYDVVVSGTLCPGAFDCASCTTSPATSRTATLRVHAEPEWTGPASITRDNDAGQCGSVTMIPILHGEDVVFGMQFANGTISHFDKSTLLQIDAKTAAISGVTSAITSTHGLAMDPITGAWFAVVGYESGSGKTRSLVSLDPSTGGGSLIGATGINISGIAFDGNGVLYAIGGSSGPGANTLCTLNTSTGLPTFVMNVSAGGGKGFAYNPDDGMLYHKYYDLGTATHGFEKIDPVARTLTSIALSGPVMHNDVTAMMYEGDGVFLVNAVIWYRLTTSGTITKPGIPLSPQNIKGLARNACPNALRIPGDCSPITVTQTAGLASGSLFPVGTTTNSYTATDASGRSATFSVPVTVSDIDAPVITVPASPKVLPSQPNKYTEYTVDELVSSVTDNCTSDPVVSILWISSDETDAGGTCGPKPNDIIIASDCKSAQFRNERCSDGNGRVYNISLKATDESGNSSFATYQVTVPKGSSPAVDDGADHTVYSACGYEKTSHTSGHPGALRLEQNYPNPFNPTTNITYDIPEDAFVLLRVFDIHGRIVSTLITEEQPAGTYTVAFDGSALPSGIYFYRLEANTRVLIGRMTLAK